MAFPALWHYLSAIEHSERSYRKCQEPAAPDSPPLAPIVSGSPNPSPWIRAATADEVDRRTHAPLFSTPLMARSRLQGITSDYFIYIIYYMKSVSFRLFPSRPTVGVARSDRASRFGLAAVGPGGGQDRSVG
jgi:hypothetical protein